VTDHQDEPVDTVTAVAAPERDIVEDPPQYGVGPFSIREVALAVVWLVAFVVSFFQVGAFVNGPAESLLFGFGSVWTSGLGWILTIALPSAAVFLLALRRLSPDGIRRVGSLGIDQFASVAFSVSAVIWLQLAWETVAFSLAGGGWIRSWVIWVELLLMLVGVALTVFGPLIPPFREDFRGRREIPAHRNARPVRAVSPRPAPAPRAATEPAGGSEPFAPVTEQDAHDARPYGEPSPDAEPAGIAATAWEPEQARESSATLEQDLVEPASVRHQAFWALAPEERDVVDQTGAPIFRVGPTAWALVVEDHGDRFVVRHEDGRVGHLLNVDGVTRG